MGLTRVLPAHGEPLICNYPQRSGVEVGLSRVLPFRTGAVPDVTPHGQEWKWA